MIKMLNDIIFSIRKILILAKNNYVCYCPKCHDILNDQAKLMQAKKENCIIYLCNNCDYNSVWNIGKSKIPTRIE